MSAKKKPVKKRTNVKEDGRFPTSKQAIVLWLALIVLAGYTIYDGVFKPDKLSRQSAVPIHNTSIKKPTFDFYQSLPKAQVNVTEPATSVPSQTQTVPAPSTIVQAKSTQPAHHSAKSPVVSTDTSGRPIQSTKPPIVSVPVQPTTSTSPATHPSASPVYVLQVAAFKQAGDADALKAQLSLLGFDAQVHPFKANNGQHWYRVWIGDFHSKSQAQKAQLRLTQQHMNSLLRRKT